MTLSPFHVHTTFCDGANTPEETVLEAIRLGCPEIGFSSHAHMITGASWGMDSEREREYKAEILRLKEKYSGEIKIFLGIEYDYYSDTDTSDYDYVIGAVHYLYKNGVYIPLDETAGHHKRAIDELYGGSADNLAKHYYETLSEIYNQTGCNIVAHFDIITKFDERERIYYPTDAYKEGATAAIDKLVKCPVAFEINTGAISRGYRTTPYPDDFILNELTERKADLVITSDSHSKDTLLFAMDTVSQSLDKREYPYFKTMEEILSKK